MHIEKGRLSIACVCMVLGFMLAIQFRTTQDIRAALPIQRVDVLAAKLQQAEAENKELRNQLEDLQGISGSEKSSMINDDMVMLAGAKAVEGPGIILTIEDSTQAVKKDNDPNLYLVHDEDLLKVINELKAAGAEAISINGQRLTANSEIRCAGPTVSVNNVRSAPPFEIRAIGSTKDLENAINMRGGVADTLKVWGISLRMEAKESLWIPSSKIGTKFKYAAASDKQEETK